jgi:hypothetical protein
MSARRVPTRLDLHRFWTREGWEQVPSTHHPTFELTTASGVMLRSRCSNPIDGTTIDDPKQWRNILVEQLKITADEFWACVDSGELPKRGNDGRGLAGRPEPEPIRPLSPSVARGLQQHLGLTGAELGGLSQEQAVAMLQQYWQDQATPGQQDGG